MFWKKPDPEQLRGTPCTCGTLERAADDPDMPVKYDSAPEEYDFVYQTPYGEGRLRIYHCWFCGGRTPESKRDTMFEIVPMEEEKRLFELLSLLKSEMDVLSTLGAADEEQETGGAWGEPERDGRAPYSELYRALVYSRLSEKADVRFMVFADGRISYSVSGKYKGRPVQA